MSYEYLESMRGTDELGAKMLNLLGNDSFS
jgi:hypothetical protein